MADRIHELRPKPADTEKITINLGYVDLGHVDLMVQEGFYSNRTDFIRTAIRNQLERHADVVKQSTARKSLDLGLRNYSREDLEAARRAGEMLHINVLGLASIAQDVTPELARATIASVSVLGSFACQSGGQGRSRRQDAVKAMLKQDIVREATRLTRAGQLVEATVLLQRMLRGETAPDATSGATALRSYPTRAANH